MVRPSDLTSAPDRAAPGSSPGADAGASAAATLQNGRLNLGPTLDLAWGKLFWERLWPRLSPAGAVLAVFFILAGFDIWRFTPIWLHAAALGLFAILLAAALLYGLKGLRRPSEAEALRRLETHNGLPHRPLTLLNDKMAGDGRDTIAAALWQIERQRAAQRIRDLKVGWPEAGWWRIDRYGIRVALGLLLVIAWASPGENAAQRLEDAINPGTAVPPGALMALDAWIAPPLYTGRAPVFLTRDGRAVQPAADGSAPALAATAGSNAPPLPVPVGSLLKFRLQTELTGFHLRLGSARAEFARADERNSELELPLDFSQGETPKLQLVRRDQVAAEWPLKIIPDTAPSIAFAEPPKTINPNRQPQLEVSLQGQDDYGVSRVELNISRPESSEGWAEDWPAPPAMAGSFTDKRPFDFTAHPLAGLEVELRLKAWDALEQTGLSDPVTVTLPGRRFTHPVAKAVQEQRRNLALKPGEWQRVAKSLRALTLAPESYRDDTAVHLALRMSAARLTLDRSAASQAAIQSLLWQTALRLEDGRTSLAEREFESAYDRLQDALDREADDPEVQKLMQELRDAMDKLAEEMQKEIEERLARGEEIEELPEDQDAMDMQDMQDMMNQAEDMAKQGDRQSAQNMLQQLQEMLRNLKNMKIARAPEGRQRNQQGRQRGNQMGSQQMGELNDMMRQQQQLLDRSFRRQQQQGRGEGNQRGENEGDARQQEDLRRRLGEMMNRFAERGQQIPDALGKADRAMRDAREALKRGVPGDAMQGQTDAMDNLRQGLRDMQQAQRGNPDGQAEAADNKQNQRNRPQRDPLGRTNNGDQTFGEQTQVPEAGMTAVERARRILEELQRRAGNRERPTDERDYLDRLLKRF